MALFHSGMRKGQEFSVSECLDRLSSLMNGLEAQGLPGFGSVDATSVWHLGISLKEYLHTLQVQNTCASLQPPAVSGSTATHTHIHTYKHTNTQKAKNLANSSILHVKFKQSCVNTHLDTFHDWNVGVSGA